MENESYAQQLSEPLTGDSTLKSEKSYKQMSGEMIPCQVISNPHTQSAVVTISPDDPPISDYLLFSVFNIMCINLCCLGFLSLVFSIKSRDRKLVGDRSGALSYGSTSRAINITATVLTILFFIIIFYVLLTSLPPLPSLMHTINAMLSGK
ncbi:dispanin subfamily A member 2b-like [Spea bombifrons]|uniref:dispanin subfamily A member 2b-like n=1 Tax=Spea bombifrons TaxID=233779 RepID=UPI00234A337A|nr:dispanin subfamily A member 2b-like [Spea bombifrons]